MTFLDKIIETKYKEIAVLDSLENLRAQAKERNQEDVRSVEWSDSLDVIAEIKRKSPSKGELAQISNPGQLAKQYEDGNCCAISVLTDKDYFGAESSDFVAVRNATHVPILRKDFIVDEKQIYESYIMGADIILLIVAAFDDVDLLSHLFECAKNLSMNVLVETHSLEEVIVANSIGADLIGVNVRDLSTFEENPEIGDQLISEIPSGVVSIWESSIIDIKDAWRAYKAGADAVLVGQGLVQSPNAREFIEQIRSISTH